ncbi:RNA polymerase sigma-70 factor [Janibacter sp. HTCC2649]|nr:RNA polymerase sigma-70 factor [Janibacter sp. HTCC2649]
MRRPGQGHDIWSEELVVNTYDDDTNTDPTGMRALLRGLPDPGPMPDDLVDRIHASLADLPPLEAGAELGDDVAADVSRGTTSASRSPWWIRHGSKAAIAAVVLIGGGAAATGQLGSLGSSDDSSTASSDTAAGAQPETQSRTTSDSDTSKSFSAESSSGAQVTLGAIVVRHSGRDYSATGLAAQSSGELGGPQSGPTITPLAAEAPGIGPIGTEIGVRSCLEALGLPRASAANVDLSTFEKAPAAVLIVTVEGMRTAYAVGRDCTTGNPSVLTGPVTLP